MPVLPRYFRALAKTDLAHGVILEPGDVLRYDPTDHANPYTLHRAAPLVVDPGALLAAVESGDVEAYGLTPVSSSSSAPSRASALALRPRSQRETGT